MGLRTVLFIVTMAGLAAGALAGPIWPICGYVLHYSVGPERQWWAAAITPLGIRYSLTMAMLTALSIAMNSGKLRYGAELFSRTEKLMLVLVAWMWLLRLITPDTFALYFPGMDHPTVKMTKVLLFVLMLTHVATDRRNLGILTWAILIGGLILGIQAYEVPYAAYDRGRLEAVGGPDFVTSNRLAAYLAALLPIIGVGFLLSRWRGKIICFLAGGLGANAIILTQSRGSVVGLGAAAVASLAMVPRKHRMTIVLGVGVGAAGFLYLANPQFLNRASTITASEGQRDQSAQSRLDLARAGLKMLQDNPLGVGPGNFYSRIGQYDPRYTSRDAHNTFVSCFADLGIPGFLLFLGIIASTGASLRRVFRESHELPEDVKPYFHWTATGLAASVACTLGCGLTGTLLYVEFAWWLLALPICLERTLANVKADLLAESAAEPDEEEQALVEAVA
jgi:putative inorganic carbon (hco3(-)) transporter